MDKSRVIISESFVSEDENGLRQNIQRVMDEYLELASKDDLAEGGAKLT